MCRRNFGSGKTPFHESRDSSLPLGMTRFRHVALCNRKSSSGDRRPARRWPLNRGSVAEQMKIAAIEAEQYRIPLAGEVFPAWAPGQVWRERVVTVFRVHTDGGHTGIGAGNGSPAFVRDVVSPKLAGADPLMVGRLVRVLRNAGPPWASLPVACGIELALWDLVGKAAGLPLYRLRGAHTDRLRAYASLVEVRAPERRAEDALRLLEMGYRALKLRLHSDTLAEDVAQVEAVRRAVGDRMEIMVDANQAQEPGTPGPRPARSGTITAPWPRAALWPRWGCAGWRSRWGATPSTICGASRPPATSRFPAARTTSAPTSSAC
jgi:hypothetical protein